MIRNLLIVPMIMLAGCGVDTLGTAAVGAATKAEEARQAQQMKADVQKRLDAVQQAEQQRLQETAAAVSAEGAGPQR